MYLGVPTLTIIKLKEAFGDSLRNTDSGSMGEIYFRDWYNCKRRVGEWLTHFIHVCVQLASVTYANQ